MKFKLGQKYKTRGGKRATVVEIDAHDPTTPLLVRHEGIADFWHYADGRVNTGSQEYDLVAEWVDEPTEPAGPVRTVTCKEIVPGTYGDVRIAHVGNGCAEIFIDTTMEADELRAAAATLLEVADALEYRA